MLEAEMYHYKDCGLDNVYLLNGYHEIETPYGTAVSIERAHELHAFLARRVIESSARLTGAELRFLRLELELSQRVLGALIGSDEQSVRRWEKSRKKPVPRVADRMVRSLYAASSNQPDVRRLLERLSELDESERSPEYRMRETPCGWDLAA
jgi:DNA-binding transcriptional regulator YiaG